MGAGSAIGHESMRRLLLSCSVPVASPRRALASARSLIVQANQQAANKLAQFEIPLRHRGVSCSHLCPAASARVCRYVGSACVCLPVCAPAWTGLVPRLTGSPDLQCGGITASQPTQGTRWCQWQLLQLKCTCVPDAPNQCHLVSATMSASPASPSSLATATRSSSPTPPLVVPVSGWCALPNTFAACMPGFCCFGCDVTHRTGLRCTMEAHQTESLFRTTFLPLHVHSGFPRLMQGGLMGVMADCLAEWTVMSTHDNIGFTTSMQMEFLKGIPAAPPSASSAIACAGGVHSVCPSRSLPQLEHLRVQAVARVTKEQGNRLVVEVLIQDLASTCVYARALIHMLLPSLGQVQRLFKGDEGKVRGYQASLANLPRPNKAVENALRLREEKAAAEKKTNKPNIAAATKSSSSPSKSPSSPSKLSSSSPSSASKPKPFHTLLPSPASLAGDEWLPLEDSLTQNIPDYNCFGCGGENESGFRSRYHVNTRTGTLRTLLAPKREWSGFPGMIQGGVATVPMDCVGSWCVMLGKQQLGLTTTMETVFLESVSLPEQESLQQQKETILILGQLISSDRTRATVVVNMYDLSSSSSGQPRLCISSRMQFALATPAMIARMLGQEYVEGVGKAMQEFKRMSEVVKKPAMEATEKGQQIKSSL